MERRRRGVGRTASRAVLVASVASFAFVALVATTPGSPFTPILPSEAGGPFRWLVELVGQISASDIKRVEQAIAVQLGLR